MHFGSSGFFQHLGSLTKRSSRITPEHRPHPLLMEDNHYITMEIKCQNACSVRTCPRIVKSFVLTCHQASHTFFLPPTQPDKSSFSVRTHSETPTSPTSTILSIKPAAARFLEKIARPVLRLEAIASALFAPPTSGETITTSCSQLFVTLDALSEHLCGGNVQECTVALILLLLLIVLLLLAVYHARGNGITTGVEEFYASDNQHAQ